MKLSYDISEPDQVTKELADSIVSLILDSAVTYHQADKALACAQELLQTNTRPAFKV